MKILTYLNGDNKLHYGFLNFVPKWGCEGDVGRVTDFHAGGSGFDFRLRPKFFNV